MKQKVIFITGSGSGIGKAVAIKLATLGNKVIATTHYSKQAVILNELARKENLALESFVLDISSKKDREKILDYDIDVLINNAAIGESGSLAEIAIDKIKHIFEINVFSTLELTQLALRGMIKKDSGRIIFISSLLGRVTSPFLAPYSMTKFALSSAADALRQEIKEISNAIFISVVEPGAYHTGFNQKMIAKKFEWMDKRSYFYSKLEYLKTREERQFNRLEEKSIDSIVKKIVEAVEDENPKLRYVAPWWQGAGFQILRILGR